MVALRESFMREECSKFSRGRCLPPIVVNAGPTRAGRVPFVEVVVEAAVVAVAACLNEVDFGFS